METGDMVLIIDDDEVALLMLKDSFEAAGLKVIATTNSTKAIKLYKKYQPVAIVLDIFMPDKDGIEIISELRKQHAEVPIIAISSYDNYLQIALQLGADKAFSKNASIQYIVDAVLNKKTS